MEDTMTKITITAALLSVLGIAAVATLTSAPVSSALARAEGYAQTVMPTEQTAMPIDQLTLAARNLPGQSFAAF
jgi:hypothetical protein